MKKLKLKALELGATEILTREQLKKVFGGDDTGGSGSGSGSGSGCKDTCTDTLFCNANQTCKNVYCGFSLYTYKTCV
jgi:hypothetical protein